MIKYEDPVYAPPIQVTTPEELRDFFNKGGIEQLAEPLDYLLEQEGCGPESKIRLTDDNDSGEFLSYWQAQGRHRLLIVQSNLARLAGLYLSVSVQPDSYELYSSGSIGASHSPRLGGQHQISHYRKQGVAMAIGEPMAAVKVQQIAKWELVEACGLAAVSTVSIA